MYALNTFFRLVRFISSTFIGLVVGYFIGVSGMGFQELKAMIGL